MITGYQIISAVSNDPKYSLILSYAGIQFSPKPFFELKAFMEKFLPPFPTNADFEKGFVKAPPEIINTIIDNLDKSGSFLVYGKGGSGKTVIARLVASHYLKKGFSVLCVDISNSAYTMLIDDMISYLSGSSHSNLLLIIDNVHSQNRFAERFHEFIQLQESHHFISLYLSRTAPVIPSEDTAIIGFLEMYGARNSPSIHIPADGDAFRYVIELYKSRGKAFNLGKRTYQEIATKFGHDLYVFSYALEHYDAGTSLDAISPQNPFSGKAIQRQYLDRFARSPEKLDVFIKIAALSSLEIPTDSGKLTGATKYDNLFSAELSDGTLLQNSSGDILLPHSSLGYIIVQYHAYRYKIRPLDIIKRALPIASSIGPYLFSLLENQTYFDFFQLLRSLFTDHDTITILLESQVILPTKLRNPVLGEKQEWYERFLIDNFSLTAKALAFTSLSTIRETLKQLFHKNTPLLKSALSSIAENRDYLWIEISRTSPHIVIDFLGEIRDYSVNPGIDSEIAKHLIGLHEHIIKCSVSSKSPYRAVLTRSSLSLGYVASFLKYLYPAHKNEHDELLSDLLLPSYSESLVQRGLSKPLDHFTNFLEHCRNVSGYNCETLLPYLRQRQKIDLFLMAFDSWQVDSSIFYMKFWESIASANCKEYVNILINELFSTTRKKAIYNKLLTSNIPQVLALYRFSQNDQQIQQCFPNDFYSLANLSKKLIKNSERIQLNQLIKTINDLSLTGSAGNLLAEYLRKLVGSDDEKILFRLFKTTDLRSTIAFLNRLRTNSSNDLFDFCLSGLRRKHYFENRLSAVLRPYQNAPIKIGRGKAGDRPTVYITQLLQFLTQNDMDYLHVILSNLRENRAAFVHALLSDHIDSVSSILSTIDSISSEETLFVDSLISEGLCSEQSFETLAFNATQKGVGYLKAFLSYSQRRNLRLCLGVLSYLKGKYQRSFLNDCSISESGQFYALLKWLDKPHPSALITSREILNSMDKQQRSNVVKSLFAATENNRKAMKEYLSSKHPDFYLAISGKEKI